MNVPRLCLLLIILPDPLQLQLEHFYLLPQVIILIMIRLLELTNHFTNLPTNGHRIFLFPEIDQYLLHLLLIKLPHRIVTPILLILLLYQCISRLHILQLCHQQIISLVLYLNVIFKSFQFHLHISCLIRPCVLQLFHQPIYLVALVLLQQLILHLRLLVFNVQIKVPVLL